LPSVRKFRRCVQCLALAGRSQAEAEWSIVDESDAPSQVRFVSTRLQLRECRLVRLLARHSWPAAFTARAFGLP
jgi:hypothetical protein